MLKEFREFAVKGNMIDLAVGIAIGAAFGAIVNSLVNDMLMPPLGALIGGMDFSNFFLVIKDGQPAGPYDTVKAANDAGAVALRYGLFLNAMINFLVVAFALFFVVKAVNKLRTLAERDKKAAEEAAPPPPTPEDVVLLTEIRDLLKQRS